MSADKKNERNTPNADSNSGGGDEYNSYSSYGLNTYGAYNAKLGYDARFEEDEHPSSGAASSPNRNAATSESHNDSRRNNDAANVTEEAQNEKDSPQKSSIYSSSSITSDAEQMVSWNEIFQQVASSIRRLESNNNTTMGLNGIWSDGETSTARPHLGQGMEAPSDKNREDETAAQAQPSTSDIHQLHSGSSLATMAQDFDYIADHKDAGKFKNETLAHGTSPFPTLAALARDFVYTAGNYGRILIEEMNLPNHLKTLKPKKSNGIGGAGGAKYVANGIYYKFCIDERGDLFNGSTNAAQKVGLCELRGVRFFFSFSQICFPLVCVIDHLGHRVVAETVLPINMQTLRVGCPDAARGRHRSQSFKFEDDELLRAMNEAGRRLNLAGHYVKAAKQSHDGVTDIYVHTPYDMEGHRGLDGRMYCIDFSRAFPPQPPALSSGGRKNSHLYCQFRPEFVMKHREPLCSDAFSKFLGPRADRNDIEQRIHRAWKVLVDENIPKLALAMKRADDARQRHLMNEQQRKLRSVADPQGRGRPSRAKASELHKPRSTRVNHRLLEKGRVGGFRGVWVSLRRYAGLVRGMLPFARSLAAAFKSGASEVESTNIWTLLAPHTWLSVASVAGSAAAVVSLVKPKLSTKYGDELEFRAVLPRLSRFQLSFLPTLAATSVVTAVVHCLTATEAYLFRRKVRAYFGGDDLLHEKRQSQRNQNAATGHHDPTKAQIQDEESGNPDEDVLATTIAARGNPGAISAFSSISSVDSRSDVTEKSSAARRGLAELHRALRSTDTKKVSQHDLTSWAEELAALPRNLHGAGINIRLLGLLRSTVASMFSDYNHILTCLLLEMIARSLKHILRGRLRRCSANSAGSARGARKHAHLTQPELVVPPQVVSSARMSAHRRVIVDLLNGVLGNELETTERWIDGAHGSQRCQLGRKCTLASCRLAHPADWPHHKSGAQQPPSPVQQLPLWTEIKRILIDKFGEEALTIEESLDGFDLKQALPNNGLIVLINRLQVMGCFSLKPDVISQLQALPRRRARFHAKGQQFAKLNQHAMPRVVLVDDDLLEIRARTKHMSELITRADGHSLLLAGLRKSTSPHAASKLFRRACVKFQEAISGSSTPNPYTIRNELSMSLALWGRMLLEQAKVWQQGEITADGTQREAQPYVEWDLDFVKQAGIRFIQVLQVMCGHNVSFKNDKKKLKKLSTVKRHVSFKSSWVHTTDSKRSRRMSAPDHASDNSEDLSQKKFYYRKDSIQELFSSTEFAVDLSTSFQSPTPIQASSQTLGKWDLWTRLQGCSIIECAAIAVLSNLYNNDCEHIDVTPYSFVSDRVVKVLAWYCHESLKHVCLGHRFPDKLAGCGSLTFAAVAETMANCFLLESLHIVGVPMEEQDVDVLAGLGSKLKVLRFERVSSITDTLVREILYKMPTLSELDFRGCANVTFDGVTEVLLEILEGPSSSMFRIQKLCLAGVAGYSLERAEELESRISRLPVALHIV